MNEEVKNILGKIQSLSEKNVEIDLVSKKKKVNCKVLTFKQQKDLMSTIAEGVVGNLKFQNYLNQIVLDNCEEKDLLVIDKIPIILKLRINSIGNSVTVDDSTLELDDIIANIKLPKIQFEECIDEELKILIKIPTIEIDNNINKAIIDSLKKHENELSKNVGDIYTHEIVKYIHSIEFGEDVVTFEKLSIKDKIKLVENLPISINNRIVKYIQNVKNIENSWLTVDVKGETKKLEIDISLFDS